MAIRNYEEILDHLRRAREWLDSLGVRAGTRLAQYEEDVAEIEKHWRIDGGRALMLERTSRRLVNSLMEAEAISDALRILRAQKSPGPSLLAKIKTCLGGPALPENENAGSANLPRNFFFEIRLAAWLLDAGLPAVAGEAPDVATEIDGCPVYVECKRPFTGKNIEGLTSSARDQLMRAFANEPAALGVIAYDLTRVVSSYDTFVECRGRAGLSDWISSRRRAFGQQYERKINSSLKRKPDPRIAGRIQYFEQAIVNSDSGRWGTGYSLEFVPAGYRSTGHRVFRELSSRMHAKSA